MSDAKNRQGGGFAQKGTDSASEFFAVGTPLHAVRASYIRRPADELLFEALLAGRYAHVIAPDQSGKTSLIAATAERLKNNGASVAVLDLEQLVLREAGTDAGRFYYSVAYRILRQLRIRFELQPWWQDKALLSNRQRLHEFYSEVILGQTRKPVVIIIDEVQCVEHLPFTDQLLTSVRSAHDARTTDPDFTRLTFALCGECDPSTIVDVPELSPFQITQSIPLRDFNRREIDLFATELNLPAAAAEAALDRIFHWTNGHPYLTQKLARAVSREQVGEDVGDLVDGIVGQQLAHRGSVNNEPLLNHVQQRVLDDPRRQQLLNLYGRIRKGIEVPTDLASPLQRKLVALGLFNVNERGELETRNRIYREVFTARWANENLKINWQVPALTVLILILFLLVPFWYTQWLPRPYVAELVDPSTELEFAETAWSNFRSFPGHTETADNLYRLYLTRKAELAASVAQIEAVAAYSSRFDTGGELVDSLRAEFFDRAALSAVRDEDRDTGLLAVLDALVVPSPERRQRAASLVGGDYADLIATLAVPRSGRRIFNTSTLTLSDIDGPEVTQWSLTDEGLRRADPWQITALEVTPLVRRIIVDQEGTVQRAALTLNIRHARHADLRIKLIAPSGKTVEIETGRDRSSMVDDIRIPATVLANLVGESLAGSWSLSIRDEEIGVAGHLVGWNLTLNAQGLIEDFQRGVDIPDPVAVEASTIWVSEDGQYAIARATHSDSARVWDLGFGKPIRAIALSQGESLIGLDADARRLVSATLDSVNLWDTASGDRVLNLPIAGAGLAGRLTGDRRHLFVSYPGDAETRFDLWSLDTGERVATFDIAGTPALVSLDHDGRRLAVADFDRSVRIWDFQAGTLIAQINLGAQPSSIVLSPRGDALGATYGQDGMSLWRVAEEARLLFEVLEPGAWRLAFAPSGDRVIAGTPGIGYTVYDSRTGAAESTPLGLAGAADAPLAFSNDESILISGGPGETVRFWRAPVRDAANSGAASARPFWHPPPGVPVAASPDARKLLVGDREGHLHIFGRNADPAELARSERREVDYLGHSAPISAIAIDESSVWGATVANDGSLRVWGLADGLPQPWLAEGMGTVLAVDFSPDGRRIAVLDNITMRFFDRATGEGIHSYVHGGSLTGLVYAASDAVYAASADEGLVVIRLRAGAAADTRRLWKGDDPIALIARSPDANKLVIVDAANVARIVSLTDGTVAADTIELPGPVREVAVAPSGSRILFRTDRWIHTALLTPDGLMWRDADLVDATGAGNRIVFDSSPDTSGRRGSPLVIRTGAAGLSLDPLDGGAMAPRVFGSREDLLADWRKRLGRDL
jgi:WD40 repeat protein